MKILHERNRFKRFQAALSLVEVLIAMAVLGILIVSLYAGFISGFRVIHISRENLRATQIMMEKMETIRLYTWEQINTPGFIPSTFTANYYPEKGNTGLVYYGTVKVTAAPQDTTYSTNMKHVVVDVRWTNSSIRRSRQMSTYVSKYGLQTYVY